MTEEEYKLKLIKLHKRLKSKYGEHTVFEDNVGCDTFLRDIDKWIRDGLFSDLKTPWREDMVLVIKERMLAANYLYKEYL